MLHLEDTVNDHSADPGRSISWADNELMWCLTYIRGVTPTEVLTRYGADPAEVQILNFRNADVIQHQMGEEGIAGTVLRLGSNGDWSFCLEDLGHVGAMSTALSRVSRDTETFSLHQNALGKQYFQYWRDSRPIERFRPGFGPRPDVSRSWWDAIEERRTVNGQELWGWLPVMQTITAYTGVAVDNETFQGSLLTVFLRDSSQDHTLPSPSTRHSTGYGLQLTQNTDERRKP
ncbi:DUF6461 domain-containing protein [Streptomyces sp. URMC 123]|uniref:DUF6461 domain-containing protein n=1 Tax=Streptomyces sp. URMC 123 TaxID=3423403 RepID=UPI003F1CA3FD